MKRLKLLVSPRIVLPLSTLLLVLLLALLLLPSLGRQGTATSASLWLEKGERIDIDLSAELTTLDGERVNLDRFKDQVLFLNFWATWCGPCRAEMPSISDLHRRLSKEGLQVVAVTDEPRETVRAYLEDSPYPFTILVDENRSLASRMGIWSIPWTLVLDRNGKLVHFHPGAKLWNQPETLSEIRKLLNE